MDHLSDVKDHKKIISTRRAVDGADNWKEYASQLREFCQLIGRTTEDTNNIEDSILTILTLFDGMKQTDITIVLEEVFDIEQELSTLKVPETFLRRVR